jgi:hypothetical protein
MTTNKAYLGDGVYVQNDGYSVLLTTENGIEETNIVYLEPEVLLAFVRYLSRKMPETWTVLRKED